MTTSLIIIGLLIAAIAVARMVLTGQRVQVFYYGIARRSGSRLDIGPVDWPTLTRHPTPNDALICPAAHCPNATPDAEPKVYPLPPADLLARLKGVALADTDVHELPCEPNCDTTARFVQYTRLMRFPDTIDAMVIPVGAGQSTLALYSRSLVGRKDFGVNRARLQRWLEKLDVA